MFPQRVTRFVSQHQLGQLNAKVLNNYTRSNIMNIEMDTLPVDLLQLVITELDLKDVSQLRKITSKGIGKNLVGRTLGYFFPLKIQDTIPWKDFYHEMTRGKGEEFAVGKYFSLEMIQRWIGFVLDITGPASDVEEDDSITEDETDILSSRIVSMRKGLIDSDRVKIFEEILRQLTVGPGNIMFLNDFDYPGEIIASDGGWNILATKIPELLARPSRAQSYLAYSSQSSDIAHYLLCKSLFGRDLNPETGNLLDIIELAPQNLGFYLNLPGFSELFEYNFDWLLNEISRSSNKLSKAHIELLTQLIEALSVEQYALVWERLLKTNSTRVTPIVKLILRDSKGSPERLIKVLNSLLSIEIRINNFKDTLGFPLSYYIGLTDEESKREVIRVLMSQSRLPDDSGSNAFFNLLSREYTYDTLTSLQSNIKSVFTWDETRELAQLILSTRSIRSRDNYKRLDAIYNSVF